MSVLEKLAGTDTAKSVCGESWAQYVVTLCRGACCHWAHPHSGVLPHQRGLQADGEQCQNDEERESVSTRVYICRLFGQDAGEIGTVYQACNWLYCGKTSGTTMYRDVTGKLRDSKLIHSAIRSRKGRSARPDETGRRFFIRDGKKYLRGRYAARRHRGGGEQTLSVHSALNQSGKKKAVG